MNNNIVNFKTASKSDLANAYSISVATLSDFIKPALKKIIEANPKAFFDKKEKENFEKYYIRKRLFLPNQTKAIIKHLGECENYEFVAIIKQ